MKTVQECLREFDMDELLNAYLAIPFIRNEMTEVMKKKDAVTGKEIWSLFRDRIRKYIEYMRNTPIEQSQEKAVLYVYEVLEGSIRDRFWHGLVYISELKDKGIDAEDYSYTLCPHRQVAGFYVADTKLTQDNLLLLMTDVLYESSFYGYTEEELEKEARMTETEEYEDASLDTDFIRCEKEQKSEEELRLRDAYSKAREEYSSFLRKKALLEVIKSLD